MKFTYLFTILIILATACGQDNSKTQKEESNKEQKTNDEPSASADAKEKQKDSNGFWEKLVMNEIRDAQGMIAAVMPLPSSWKIMMANSNGGPTLTGPNGLTVTDFPLRSFMYNYNASLQQSYDAAGQQMRAMPGVEQLIQEDFVPWGNGKGLQLVKYYEIPEISKMDKWYSDQLYKAMPSQSDIAAIGIEWKSNDGKPYFLLVHLNVSTSQQMQQWYYMVSGLEADEPYFETARKQYIFSLANMRYNLEPIMAYNQKEAQRIGRSWAAFNQRMAQNQASFEASQRAFVNKSNAINDAIMSGWRERNASSDKQQEQTIDGIYERSNVQNTETGQQYKVAAGANQYWMNSNGEYISTQLNDYNPNQDENLNEQKWQQLKQVKN